VGRHLVAEAAGSDRLIIAGKPHPTGPSQPDLLTTATVVSTLASGVAGLGVFTRMRSGKRACLRVHGRALYAGPSDVDTEHVHVIPSVRALDAAVLEIGGCPPQASNEVWIL
jgi:hypothetical protein